MLFSKQNFKISRVSCILKLLQIKTRSLLLAYSLVSGLSVYLGYSKLITELVYIESEYVYYYLGVGKVV